MNKNNQDLSKEELRRAKRKRSQALAFGLLAGAVVIILAIIIGIGVAVYHAIKPVQVEPVEETEKIVIKQSDSLEEDLENIVSDNTTEETSEDVVEETADEEAVEEDKDMADTDDVAEEETADEDLETQVQEIVDSMTLEEKIAGLFIVTPEILAPNCNDMKELNDSFTAALTKYPVGGVVLDAGNMESDAQVKQLTADLQGVNANEMFVAVTEHGGSSSDLVKAGILESPIMSETEIGATNDASNAYAAGTTIATVANNCGFNLVLGPVADVAYQTNGYTSKTSFGDDADEICDMITNIDQGFEENNVNNCVQYFPGYGDITNNPTTNRAFSSRTREDIDTEEYPIYKAAINSGADMIMVSNVSYRSITTDVPACLSEEIVTEMLRGDLGYDGIIITDALNTSAMYNHYKHGDMAVMAIEAGCDMLYCPGNFEKAYNALLKAVQSGEITEDRINESLYRIYRVKCADEL